MNQQKCKRQMPGILLIPGILLFITVETILPQSSENYKIKKSAVNQGGNQSQSANYQTTDAVGQSSAVSTSISENYTVSSGLFGGYESEFTPVDEGVSMVLPEKFMLLQNYPNPFNPVTQIEYHLPHNAEVELTIFDIQGHEVHKLINGIMSAGYYTAMWNGTDIRGNIVASGLYLYRIEMKATNNEQQSYVDVKKMIMMK